MENKQTAMQIMLMDLEYKQHVYEEKGLFECATALVTSIELAKYLIKTEKEELGLSFARGYLTGYAGANGIESIDFDEYYKQTYNQ